MADRRFTVAPEGLQATDTLTDEQVRALHRCNVQIINRTDREFRVVETQADDGSRVIEIQEVAGV